MNLRVLGRVAGAVTSAVGLCTASLCGSASAQSPPSALPPVIYVSPTGNDAWSGRVARRQGRRGHVDGPVATLDHARDLLRAMPGTTKTMVLGGGTYSRTGPLVLSGEDAGLTIQSTIGETAVVLGGQTVSDWKPIADPAIRERLDPAVRANVFQADLKALGITDFGRLSARGFDRPGAPAPLELFWNDAPMTLARWPNSVNGDTGPDTWATVGVAPAKAAENRFGYTGDRPARWKNTDDIWLHGYWAFDWADTYDRVSSIDLAEHEITTAAPNPPFGTMVGKRWYALNVLEELDTPGEYYVDRKSGILYFYPPVAVGKGNTVVSLVEAPLIHVDHSRDITIRGLTIEDSRGDGIDISDSSHVTVTACTVRNMGRSGVMVSGGDHCAVRDSDLYGLGEKGVGLTGGDRATLTRCDHEAVNCDIHDYSRWVRTYQAGVDVTGVGIRVANCHIHRAPHNAILLSGNDNLIERNNIDHVCEETGDAGAFYMGRNWTMRGNVVRANWFHDLNGVRGQAGFTDVMAVYLDDIASGTLVEDNVFERIHGRAIMVGGGRDDRILNNLFVRCLIAVHVDARAQGWAKDKAKRGGDWRLYPLLDEVHFDKPPYSTRYPELATMLTGDPTFPQGTVVEHNVVADIAPGGEWLVLQDGLTDKTLPIRDNLTSGDTGVVVPPDRPAYLRPDSPAFKMGIHPLPRETVGKTTDGTFENLGKIVPIVPVSLRTTNYNATAIVRVTFGRDGTIDAKITKSSGYPDLDKEVLSKCRSIKVRKPAMMDGIPVESTHEIMFTLMNKG